jgi:hypothetical protein
MAKLPPLFNVQLFDNSGEPLAGGKIYTYDNGTTDNKTTFQDANEVAANTNPIILDSAGRASIYLEDGAYTFRVDTSADVTLYTVDDITGDVANAFGSSVQDISSNTSVTTAQQNSVLICTGSPTLSLLAAANAEEGFVFTVKNNGTGTVTIDPNAAETIDGAATKDVAAGYTVLVVCDGTNWRTAFEGPSDFTGTLLVNGTASSAAAISLAEDTDNGTDTITLQAPASLASDLTLTLPSADGTSGQALVTDGAGTLSFDTVETVAQDHIAGLILSNDTDTDHDINITAGQAADSTNASYLTLASEITKQIDATWAEGNDAGGLFSGSVSTNTTYHVFLIEKDSDGSIDAGFDTSVTAANIPSGYTKYRRIGSVVTDGSSNIQPFEHRKGDFFEWLEPELDINDGATGTTAKTAAINVPLGIQVTARCNGALASNGVFVYVSTADATDTAPSASSTPLSTMGNTSSANLVTQFDIETNTSSQIRYRTNTSDTFRLVTVGYYDYR